MNGYLIVNKDAGMTSQTVVTRVKRLFGVAKAGHTGTLDPEATGVLPVMLGRAVKAGEYMLSSEKHYVATLRLGMTSDTQDVFGHLTPTGAPLPEVSAVLATADKFRGEIMQTPPMVSALKVGGKKLVDLAREGIEVERQPRPVTVYELHVTPLSESDYRVDVRCSRGTYIRTLCADIGAALGVGGVMASLCRVEAAGFPLSAAHTLAELEEMTPGERATAVLPTETVFAGWRRLELPPFFARLARCGVEIYLKKLGTDAPVGERCSLWDGGKFFAVGEVREYPAGLAVKPVKQFDI